MTIDRKLFDELFGMLGKRTQEEAATHIGVYLQGLSNKHRDEPHTGNSTGAHATQNREDK